ncbi:MAG: hypothetical protein CUN55_06930 [Phototrophicales bacterium]|nr:MAG: hypothetical protein CUN55_06930 [Phototrophicales bacterium]
MKRKAIFLTTGLLLIASLLAMSITTSTTKAETNTQGRTITVTGIGSASGVPDIAILSIGVETAEQNIAPALQSNNNAIDAVISALEAQGVSGEDIRTEYFNIFQDRYSVDPMLPVDGQAPSTYLVTHILNVTVRDINSLGGVLNTAIEAGANVVNNVYFDISDRITLENQARVAALENAREHAQQIADQLGVELGEVITVVEGDAYGIPYAAQERGLGGGGGSIVPGVSSVSVAVTVTFAVSS